MHGTQVLAMCFVRKGLDRVFDQRELKWLDDIMPEAHKRAKEDEIIKQEEVRYSSQLPLRVLSAVVLIE